MTSAGLRTVVVASFVGLTACRGGSKCENEAEPGCDDGAGGTLETSGGESTAASEASGTTEPADESGSDDAAQGECILWLDDECGAEQKCMPFSPTADRTPDAIQCCPAAANPDLEDEPCTIEDYDGSCVDSCEAGTMCVLDDGDTLGGQCRRFCEPGADDCRIDQTCKTFFELLPTTPTVPLCMDKCDPIAQDCDLPTWPCIPDSPTEAGQSGFICVSPPPGPPVGLLGVCGFANDCEKGLVCVSSSRVPDCQGVACCTAYCDLAEGDGPCTDIDPGLSCVDWMSPEPQWDHVGACAIPD